MTDKTADPAPLPPAVTLDYMEVIPYPLRRGWVLRYERHKTFRRSRRGPYRGLVQALIEDKTGGRKGLSGGLQADPPTLPPAEDLTLTGSGGRKGEGVNERPPV